MSSANITLFNYALIIFLGEAALIQSLTLHKHGSADCSALEFKPSSVQLYEKKNLQVLPLSKCLIRFQGEAKILKPISQVQGMGENKYIYFMDSYLR